ncbi:MAG: redox-regulated ATPase YchF [Dehalococcoidia bacterium]|nr:redox-regulated ATPase YchF [Dehalococcoidia bacterium]
MEIGIIGFPQSGKSTLLSALTRGRSEASTAGSSRQDVLVGTTRMHDARLDTLAGIYNPKKVVHAEVTYWDVPAVAEGGDRQGIGGQYLNLLQGADAFIVVVRAFHDPSVPHESGSVDPLRDVEAMQEELALSDLVILERRIARIEAGMKGARAGERDNLLREADLLGRVREKLEGGVPLRDQELSSDEHTLLSNYQFLTGKPLLLVFNSDEDGQDSQPDLSSWMQAGPGVSMVSALSLCAKLEMELAQLPPEDEAEFRSSMDVGEPALEKVVSSSYRLLGLISFFTVGPDEVRAWTVKAGTEAPGAAGKIHSDMERGYIRAEVVTYEDLARWGSIPNVKKEGRFRLEGKSYVVQDGDVMNILFNV